MRHPLLESAFVLAVFSVWTHSAVAQAECSTEKVNGSCTVYIDRRYPVTSPTIQMRRGQRVRVVVLNSLPSVFTTIHREVDSSSATNTCATPPLDNSRSMR
jgi:hypothetical protein